MPNFNQSKSYFLYQNCCDYHLKTLIAADFKVSVIALGVKLQNTFQSATFPF
jgi:hypothetical protein